jgi:hypothetical protein
MTTAKTGNRRKYVSPDIRRARLRPTDAVIAREILLAAICAARPAMRAGASSGKIAAFICDAIQEAVDAYRLDKLTIMPVIDQLDGVVDELRRDTTVAATPLLCSGEDLEIFIAHLEAA